MPSSLGKLLWNSVMPFLLLVLRWDCFFFSWDLFASSVRPSPPQFHMIHTGWDCPSTQVFGVRWAWYIGDLVSLVENYSEWAVLLGRGSQHVCIFGLSSGAIHFSGEKNRLPCLRTHTHLDAGNREEVGRGLGSQTCTNFLFSSFPQPCPLLALEIPSPDPISTHTELLLLWVRTQADVSTLTLPPAEPQASTS